METILIINLFNALHVQVLALPVLPQIIVLAVYTAIIYQEILVPLAWLIAILVLLQIIVHFVLQDTLTLPVLVVVLALLAIQQAISIQQQRHAKLAHQDVLLAPQVLFVLHVLQDHIYQVQIAIVV